jgi:hypothetical protein
VSAPSGDSSAERPEDVVTGFWLWVIALPLMVTGYLVAVLNTSGPTPMWVVNSMAAVFVVNTAAVVTTMLILVRLGYRWARTLLTGGGAASVGYVVSNLFSFDGPAPAAVVFAATTIIGSVLILGGAFLLHRKDAHAFFVH